MKKLLCLILSLSLCPLFGVYPAAEEASSPAQSLKNFGVYADLNLNGRTDVGDALLILQYSVGKITPTQSEISAADLDGDGKVTVSDALLDLQYSMGMFSIFAAGGKTGSRIIYPSGCSQYVLDAVKKLQSFINEQTGAKILFSPDSRAEQAGDILIGNTNRSLSSEISSELSQGEFAVKESGGQLAICSYSDETLLAAAEYLTNFLKSQNNACMLSKDFGFCSPFDTPAIPAKGIKVCKNDISDFVITADSALSPYAEVIKQRILSVSGKEIEITNGEGQKSIVLSNDPENELEGPEIKVEISDDKILIAAKGERINDAVNYFCTKVISAENYSNGFVLLDSSQNFKGDILKNPATEMSCPDPFVKYVDGYYYAIFTEATRLTLYRSRYLSTVTTDEQLTVYTGGWDVIQSDIWAPEFYFDKNQNKWYIYANGTLSPGNYETQRLFCLESDGSELWGNYHFKGILGDGYCIDASPYYNEYTDTLYLTYVSAGGGVNRIATAKMENPWTMDEQSRTVISSPTLSWELETGKVNEGGCFIEQNGKLYICFSANNGDSKEYCLGLLEFKGDYKKDDLTDQSKWQKLSRPLLRAGGGIYCTGHNSFFLSPDGSELWIAFHGRTSTEEATWHRPLCFMKAKLDKNGNFIMDSVPDLAGSFMKEPSRNG